MGSLGSASDDFDSSFGRGAGKAAEKTAEPAPTALAYSKMAEQARQAGDRKREAELLRRAIQVGASGETLANVLEQLCDAELSLGLQGQDSCERVMQEFPRTQWAERVKRKQSPAVDAPSKSKTAPAKASEKSLGNMQQAF